MFPAFHSASPMRRWASTNLNESGFASLVSTTTKPTASATRAVISGMGKPGGPGTMGPTWMKLFFILLGADDDVSSFRLVGWNRVMKDTLNDLWVPQPFAEFSVTASTAVGVAGAAVLNTERFADTIAPVALMLEDGKIAAGTSLTATVWIHTPANNTPGHVIIPTRAFELLEFTSDQTTGTSTANILYSWLR